MSNTRASRVHGLAAVALIVTGCLSSQDSRVGTPVGRPALLAVDQTGGSVVSPDGVLTVTIPPGALAGLVEISIQPITNTAPQGQGLAYRLGPADTSFDLPVTLSFSNQTGQPLSSLAVTRLISYGWLRIGATADTVSNSLVVTTDSFGTTDWAIALGGFNQANDLVGDFSLDTTVDMTFTATGRLHLVYLGADAAGTYFSPTGQLTISSPIPAGATSCTPDTPPGPAASVSSTAITEVRTAPDRLLWAVNAYWPITCQDMTTDVASTQFDTLGINLPRCARTYVGVPIVSATQLECDALNGCSYVIDCGVRGRTVATWSFAPCPAGTTCN